MVALFRGGRTTYGQLREVPVLFMGEDASVGLLSHCAASPMAEENSTEA